MGFTSSVRYYRPKPENLSLSVLLHGFMMALARTAGLCFATSLGFVPVASRKSNDHQIAIVLLFPDGSAANLSGGRPRFGAMFHG
jgi:hypothetical protein